jgi:hypothetical protein
MINSQRKKPGENGFDTLLKVRSLLQKLTDKFQQTYCPEEAVTVDEGMCPFRGEGWLQSLHASEVQQVWHEVIHSG